MNHPAYLDGYSNSTSDHPVPYTLDYDAYFYDDLNRSLTSHHGIHLPTPYCPPQDYSHSASLHINHILSAKDLGYTFAPFPGVHIPQTAPDFLGPQAPSIDNHSPRLEHSNILIKQSLDESLPLVIPPTILGNHALRSTGTPEIPPIVVPSQRNATICPPPAIKATRTSPSKETKDFLSERPLQGEPESITALRNQVRLWMIKNPDSTHVTFSQLGQVKLSNLQEDNFILALLRPIRSEGRKRWNCYGCTYSVARRDRAMDHIRAHCQHKPYLCENACGRTACEKRFSSTKERQTHITDSRKAKPICTYCGIVQTSKNLKRHQLSCKKRNPGIAHTSKPVTPDPKHRS